MAEGPDTIKEDLCGAIGLKSIVTGGRISLEESHRQVERPPRLRAKEKPQ